jgi:hypothetical protein
LNKSKSCADIGLLDNSLFQRCFLFYSSVTELLFLALSKRYPKEKEPSPALLAPGEPSKQSPLANVGGFMTTSTIGGISIQFPMPVEAGQVFASLPEWIVEDMADFALFSLQ